MSAPNPEVKEWANLSFYKFRDMKKENKELKDRIEEALTELKPCISWHADKRWLKEHKTKTCTCPTCKAVRILEGREGKDEPFADAKASRKTEGVK